MVFKIRVLVLLVGIEVGCCPQSHSLVKYADGVKQYRCMYNFSPKMCSYHEVVNRGSLF